MFSQNQLDGYVNGTVKDFIDARKNPDTEKAYQKFFDNIASTLASGNPIDDKQFLARLNQRLDVKAKELFGKNGPFGDVTIVGIDEDQNLVVKDKAGKQIHLDEHLRRVDEQNTESTSVGGVTNEMNEQQATAQASSETVKSEDVKPKVTESVLGTEYEYADGRKRTVSYSGNGDIEVTDTGNGQRVQYSIHQNAGGDYTITTGDLANNFSAVSVDKATGNILAATLESPPSVYVLKPGREPQLADASIQIAQGTSVEETTIADTAAPAAEQQGTQSEAIEQPTPSEASERVKDPRKGKREFEATADGGLQYEIRQGDTLSFVAYDALRNQDPQHWPTRSEIEAETQRIYEANKHILTKGPHKINVGQTLTIPSVEQSNPPADQSKVPDGQNVAAVGEDQEDRPPLWVDEAVEEVLDEVIDQGIDEAITESQSKTKSLEPSQIGHGHDPDDPRFRR